MTLSLFTIERLIKQGLNMILVIFIMREFQSTETSKIFQLMLFTAIGSTFVNFGSNQLLPKYYNLLKKNKFDNSLYSQISFSAIVTIIFICFSFLPFITFFQQLILLNVAFSLNLVFKRMRDLISMNSVYFIVEITLYIVFFSLKLFLLKSTMNITYLIVLIVIENAFLLLIQILFTKKILLNICTNLHKLSWYHITPAFLLLSSSLLSVLSLKLGEVILLEFLSSESYSMYSFSIRILETSMLVIMTLIQYRSAYWSSDENLNEEYFRKSYRILNRVAIGMVVVTIAVAPVLQFFLGRPIFFLEMVILAFSIPFITSSSWSSQYIFSKLHKSIYLYKTLSTALVGLTLFGLLILYFGYTGAVIAYVTTQFYTAFIFDLFVAKLKPLIAWKLSV